MNYKFNALNHGLHSIRESKNPGAVRGRDGCLRNPWTAGRSGCTPAEPYPPDRQVQIYMKKRNVPGFPVDKPHTRSLAAKNSLLHPCLRSSVVQLPFLASLVPGFLRDSTLSAVRVSAVKRPSVISVASWCAKKA